MSPFSADGDASMSLLCLCFRLCLFLCFFFLCLCSALCFFNLGGKGLVSSSLSIPDKTDSGLGVTLLPSSPSAREEESLFKCDVEILRESGG